MQVIVSNNSKFWCTKLWYSWNSGNFVKMSGHVGCVGVRSCQIVSGHVGLSGSVVSCYWKKLSVINNV